MKQLQKRQREQALLQHVSECLNLLYDDPRQSGLYLETLNTNTPRPVLSARIDRSNRLILTPLAPAEVGLLYFNKHDDAYDWVRRQGPQLSTMLSKDREAPQGTRFTAGLSLIPAVRDEDSPIALASAAQFHQMVGNGVARYLTYLDEDQRRLAVLRVSGLLLVKGGAGTGKTAVAIQRLINLARQPALLGPQRVLYLCYNAVLARVVNQLVEVLMNKPRPSGIEIRTSHAWCLDFLREHNLAAPTERQRQRNQDLVAAALEALAPEQRAVVADLDSSYVYDEIVHVIKHNGLSSREQYVKFNREGRGVGLKEAQRAVIWDVYEAAESARGAENVFDWDDLPNMAMAFLDRLPTPPQYRAVIVDEAQDCTPVMMRLARRLVAGSNGALTVFADPAQAIYEHGFQWTQRELRPAGGNVRWLRKNYRCTREIDDLARPLLEDEPALTEDLAQVQRPARRGPKPTLLVTRTREDLLNEMAERVRLEVAGRPANQVAVLASRTTLQDLAALLSQAGVDCELVERNRIHMEAPTVKLLTQQSAKCLDFPVVFLIPTRPRDDSREAELRPEAKRTLYVGLTRASEWLTIGTVYEAHPVLLEKLDPAHYTAEGQCTQEFVATRGIRLV